MAVLVTRLSHHPVDRRVLRGAFSRLEPGAGKLARRVLRGGVSRKARSLPDYPPRASHFPGGQRTCASIQYPAAPPLHGLNKTWALPAGVFLESISGNDKTNLTLFVPLKDMANRSQAYLHLEQPLIPDNRFRLAAGYSLEIRVVLINENIPVLPRHHGWHDQGCGSLRKQPCVTISAASQ